jgi:hypothetical protein
LTWGVIALQSVRFVLQEANTPSLLSGEKGPKEPHQRAPYNDQSKRKGEHHRPESHDHVDKSIHLYTPHLLSTLDARPLAQKAAQEG